MYTCVYTRTNSRILVAVAFHFQPTPLYVMDEIDAALDFKNVSIVAHYIKERTKNAQFIIISLRNNMFEVSTFIRACEHTVCVCVYAYNIMRHLLCACVYVCARLRVRK